MPSPFPGMDPYLEHPEVFSGLHDNFLTYLQEALQPLLPNPYYAYGGQRAWVVVVRVPHDERHESYVEIFVRKGEQRLVTHVELLSWANKCPGEHGRDLYLRKQREILTSKAHLVEIDLLRGGKHTTAVPLERAQAEAGTFDYHVCAHRFDNLEDYFLYPIRLEDRLPEIAVPLLPGDGSVAVDLQAVFNRCYDSGPYRRLIRYGVDAIKPALSGERAEWARERIEGSSRS